MGSSIKGLDKLQKQLKQMEKGSRELSRKKEIAFSELFTTRFMNRYTQFSSFDKLLEAGGFEQEDFAAIPDDVFDEHINKHTCFSTWERMLDEATTQYVSNKLGL